MTAVCAVSCVGRGEGEKIKIQPETKVKIRQEIGDLWKKLKEERLEFASFYQCRPDLEKYDRDTLCRVLTEDLLEYLAFGGWRYNRKSGFSEFAKNKFSRYKPEERWKFVTDFLTYAFNGSIGFLRLGGYWEEVAEKRIIMEHGKINSFLKPCYGLEIFNFSFPGLGGLSDELVFPKGCLEVGWLFEKAFSEKVLKLLWADVEQWFKDPKRKYMKLFVVEQDGRQHDHLEGTNDLVMRPIYFLGDKIILRELSFFFYAAERQSLMTQESGSGIELSNETKEKILEITEKYIAERFFGEIFFKKTMEAMLCPLSTLEAFCNPNKLKYFPPAFRKDRATLFRFFTVLLVKDVVRLCREGKIKSPEAFKKEDFPEYMSYLMRKAFGFLEYHQGKWTLVYQECGSELKGEPVPRIPGFPLHFRDFIVRRATLLRHPDDCFMKKSDEDERYRLQFSKVFEKGFLSSIANLLYPELSGHLKKLFVKRAENTNK